MEKELTKKEIRGLNVGTITHFVSLILVGCSLYFGLKAQIDRISFKTDNNNDILIDIKKENKDNQKINDDRLKVVEQVLREHDIRLTIIETEMKDKKQP